MKPVVKAPAKAPNRKEAMEKEKLRSRLAKTVPRKSTPKDKSIPKVVQDDMDKLKSETSIYREGVRKRPFKDFTKEGVKAFRKAAKQRRGK